VKRKRKWAKCDECGGEVWFDAWVDLNGEVAGGPYDNTFCEHCEGEATYTEVEGEPDPCEDEDDDGLDNLDDEDDEDLDDWEEDDDCE